MRTRLAQAAASAAVLALSVLLWRNAARPPAPRDVPAPPEPTWGGQTGSSAVPCDVPLAWRVARVDPRFGMTRAEVGAAVERAAAMWEGRAGRSLFVHDSVAGFPIRLTYDERQAEGRARRDGEGALRSSLDSLEARRAPVEALAARHSEDLTRYERDATALAARLAAHNEAVRSWNARGDAPAATLAALAAAGDTLRAMREDLSARRDALEALGVELAAAQDDLDRRLEEHELRARALRERFPAIEAEAAVYSEAVRAEGERVTAMAREIRVYRFDDAADLERIVAHELGHALGLGHADVEPAIMSGRFDLTGAGDDAESVQPADLALLRSRCPDWFVAAVPGGPPG